MTTRRPRAVRLHPDRPAPPDLHEHLQESAMSTADLRVLAATAKQHRPDLYAHVTGRPVWADAVGPEHTAAEAAWLAFIRRNL